MPTTPLPHDSTTSLLRKRRSAFTLIELLLVVLKITIVVGITVPSLRGVAANSTVDEVSGQLLALTHYARSQAVAEGVAYRLNVDVNNRTYYLTKQDGADFVELGIEFGRVFDVPEG